MAGPTPEQLDLARKSGYSEEEIQAYLGQLGKEQAAANYGASQAGPGIKAPQIERPASFEDVRQGGGAPFWDRVMASFKSTPQERFDFYKKRMGPENVMTTPGGEILFKKDGKWKSVEDAGFTFGDIADLAGDSPELAGMMAGGGLYSTLLKRIAGATVGAGAGNIVKQSVGAALPGESDRGFDSRALEVARSAGAGGVSQVLGDTLAKGKANPLEILKDTWNATVPPMVERRLAARAQKLGTTPVAQEGRELTEKTGFPLNLAEETQDPWAKMLLGFAYRNAYGQELAKLDQRSKDVAALAMFKRMSGKLGQEGGFNSASFADTASRAGLASVRDIEESLKKHSTENFGFLQRPEAAVNNINFTNRNAMLDREAQYFASMGTPEGLKTAQGLRAMMATPEKDMATGVGRGNVRLAQKELQEFGEEGFGRFEGDFYKGLSKSEQTRLSKALWGAVRQDVQAAAEGGNAQAQQLLSARKGTEELLSLRERLREVPLIQMMKSKGMLNRALNENGFVGNEAISKELLDGMRTGKITPSEIANMTKLMQAVNPNFVHEFARHVIDSAVLAGREAGKNRPSRFAYEAAAKALPSPEYLQAMYKDIWDEGAKTSGVRVANDLTMLMRAIDRAETVGQGIPHSPGSTVLSILGHLTKGNITAAGQQAASQILFPKAVGNVAMSHAAKMQAQLAARAEAASATPTEGPKGFLRKYVTEQLPRVLPAAVYEAGTSIPRSNHPETGE